MVKNTLLFAKVNYSERMTDEYQKILEETLEWIRTEASVFEKNPKKQKMMENIKLFYDVDFGPMKNALGEMEEKSALVIMLERHPISMALTPYSKTCPNELYQQLLREIIGRGVFDIVMEAIQVGEKIIEKRKAQN